MRWGTSIEWATARAPSTASGRAAGLGAVGLLVGPELDGDADHVGPALPFEQRGDGAVDATGQGDRHAPLPRRRQPLLAGRRGGQRPVQGIGRELRRVPLGRGEPAEDCVDLIGPDPGAVEDGLAVDHLGDRSGCRPGRAAALGVEADRIDPAGDDRD